MIAVFAALLAIASVPLAIREIRAYRRRDDLADDLFVYSRRRLVRRLFGLGVLAGVGATLLVWELATPSDARAASILMMVLLAEILALIVIGVLDLRETSRTARFNQLVKKP